MTSGYRSFDFWAMGEAMRLMILFIMTSSFHHPKEEQKFETETREMIDRLRNMESCFANCVDTNVDDAIK